MSQSADGILTQQINCRKRDNKLENLHRGNIYALLPRHRLDHRQSSWKNPIGKARAKTY